MRGKYIKCIFSKCDGSGAQAEWGTHLRTVDIIVFQIALLSCNSGGKIWLTIPSEYGLSMLRRSSQYRDVELNAFAYAKTNPQIRCTVTAQLISAFIFLSLYLLNAKFKASSHLL